MNDLISRQAAIDALNGEITVTGRLNAEAVMEYTKLVADRIKRLPPEQPERKRGKWVKQNPFVDTEECSICKYNIYNKELETPFCPWCGAQMDERREE